MIVGCCRRVVLLRRIRIFLNGLSILCSPLLGRGIREWLSCGFGGSGSGFKFVLMTGEFIIRFLALIFGIKTSGRFSFFFKFVFYILKW